MVTGERAIQFTGNGHVKGVVTNSGEIACDNVILAVGVRPAIKLAKDAGIEIGTQGGIKTDSHMMTSTQDIYAAGDVCETFDIARNSYLIDAIWPMAVEQGRIAGLNMAEQETEYAGSLRMNSIGNFIGFPAVSMGITRAVDCICTDEACHL